MGCLMSKGPRKEINPNKIIESVLAALIAAGIIWAIATYVKPRVFPSNEPQIHLTLSSETEKLESLTPESPSCTLLEIREGEVVQCLGEGLTFSLHRSTPYGNGVLTLIVAGGAETQRITLPTASIISVASLEGEYSVSLQSFNKSKGIANINVFKDKNITK